MAVEWTHDLSVGVKHIDDQHKIWFQKANELFPGRVYEAAFQG